MTLSMTKPMMPPTNMDVLSSTIHTLFTVSFPAQTHRQTTNEVQSVRLQWFSQWFWWLCLNAQVLIDSHQWPANTDNNWRSSHYVMKWSLTTLIGITSKELIICFNNIVNISEISQWWNNTETVFTSQLLHGAPILCINCRRLQSKCFVLFN